MKDFQKLIDFRNLYNSYTVSMRHNRNKQAAMQFDSMALENILTMKRQIISRTYTISAYVTFWVSDPKRREVKAGSFKDKVLQHCLCDYVLLPRMQNEFIRNNFAGQKGKGTLFGLDTLSKHLIEFHHRYGCEGYILKCDITKFFFSINHDILKEIIRYHFEDEGIQWICNLFIDSTEGIGLPLGNQCSQVFALMYLNGMDYFITKVLHCEYYGRYMDDFYLISNDKEYLRGCLIAIERLLNTLKLSLNSKTEIVPIRKGIRFLGFHTYITEEGKVIRKLPGDKKRAVKKKLKKRAKLVKKSKMTRKEFDERYNSWRNHVLHGNCIKLVRSMDEFVNSLF